MTDRSSFSDPVTVTRGIPVDPGGFEAHSERFAQLSTSLSRSTRKVRSTAFSQSSRASS